MSKNIYILGINSVYHDTSACLIKNGKIIATAEEERFNRKKHAKPANVDNPDELPLNSINFCLKEAGIEFRDLNHIAFSFNPEKRFKKYWSDEKYFTKNSWGTKQGEKIFYKKLISIPSKLEQIYKCDIKNKFHWVDHHLSHAASSFFVSPFEESIVVVIDGIAENETCWIGYGEGNKLTKLKEIQLPNSIGFLWEKFSEYLGFTEYDSGKIMGLSSYGDWKVYWKQFSEIVSFAEDDIFKINNEILRFRTNDFSGLENLFRIQKRNKDDEILREHENIAATLQKISEKIILRIINWAHKQYPCKNLCLSGGVILNCVANEYVFLKLPIEDVFVPSATNDGGTSMGAVYYVWNQKLKHKRGFIFDNPYIGPKFDSQSILFALKESQLKFKKMTNIEKHTAELIANGNIVAWFQDRMEFGPRALGNRSILADPRKKEMIKIINTKVKHREYFRPFAPSVLEEKAKNWFYLKKPLLPDRFMLFAVSPIYPEKIPAVTHIDETCRIQTVSKETNPKYHKLIQEFEKITGIPIVLNTSFNIQEPIVCTPKDAIDTFKKSKMDYLIIGDYLIENQKDKFEQTSFLSDVSLNDKEAKSLSVILISKGCEYALKGKGPCTMCNYWIQHSKNVTGEEIIQQFKTELSKYDFSKENIQLLNIYNSGSFLNDTEIPDSEQKEILKIANDIPQIKKILVESRPEHITTRKLKEYKKIIPDKKLEITIGLESFNDKVREKIINKGFSLKDFERAASSIANEKIDLGVYVTLKPLYLTEKESIEDAINTIKYIKLLAKKLRVNATIHLEPVIVKSPSPTYSLWKKCKYSPVKLWSVIEVLKQSFSPKLHIHIGLNDEGMNFKQLPYNCDRCSADVIEAIEKFNKKQDLIVFANLNCECKEEWKKMIK